MNTKYVPFTPANTAILLVDHQPGVLAMAGSVPASVVTSNAALLARLGEQLNIPLVITSTREARDFLGTTLKEIQAAAPKAYARRIRHGTYVADNRAHEELLGPVPSMDDAVKRWAAAKNLIL